MFAIASIAHMNTIQFAMHTVRIKSAIGYSAGYAVVDLMLHRNPPFTGIMCVFSKILQKRIDK